MESSAFFKVLSVETRVKIIELLKDRGSLGAVEISTALGISTAAVSQHLKVLKTAGLVKSERRGYWIPYSIDPATMDAFKSMVSEVCTCRPHRGILDKMPPVGELGRLKAEETRLKEALDTVQAKIRALEDPPS